MGMRASQQMACHLQLRHAQRIENVLYWEMQHRSNNLLSIVEVITRHSLSSARTLDQGRRSDCRHWRALIATYSHRRGLGSVCARL
jgi:hypothetical protein